jgi:hypothetical protein
MLFALAMAAVLALSLLLTVWAAVRAGRTPHQLPVDRRVGQERPRS